MAKRALRVHVGIVAARYDARKRSPALQHDERPTGASHVFEKREALRLELRNSYRFHLTIYFDHFCQGEQVSRILGALGGHGSGWG
jgi:hypothetical protein